MKDDLLALDPALREKAKRWFAEAREQIGRDDEQIAAWRRASAAVTEEAEASATTAAAVVAVGAAEPREARVSNPP